MCYVGLVVGFWVGGYKNVHCTLLLAPLFLSLAPDLSTRICRLGMSHCSNGWHDANLGTSAYVWAVCCWGRKGGIRVFHGCAAGHMFITFHPSILGFYIITVALFWKTNRNQRQWRLASLGWSNVKPPEKSCFFSSVWSSTCENHMGQGQDMTRHVLSNNIGIKKDRLQPLGPYHPQQRNSCQVPSK